MASPGLAALFAGLADVPAEEDLFQKRSSDLEKSQRDGAARKTLALALASAPKIGDRIAPTVQGDAGAKAQALVKAMFPDAGGGAGPASFAPASSAGVASPPSAPPGTEPEQMGPSLGPGQNPFGMPSAPLPTPENAPDATASASAMVGPPGSDPDLMGKILKLTGQGPDLSASLGRPVEHRDIAEFLRGQIKTPEDFALLSPIAENYEKIADAKQKGDLDKATILSTQLSREMQGLIKGMQENGKNVRQGKDLEFKGDQGQLNRDAALQRTKLVEAAMDRRSKRTQKDSDLDAMTPEELTNLIQEEARDQSDYGHAMSGLDAYSDAGKIDRGAYNRRITDSVNRVARARAALLRKGSPVPHDAPATTGSGTKKTTAGGEYDFVTK